MQQKLGSQYTFHLFLINPCVHNRKHLKFIYFNFSLDSLLQNLLPLRQFGLKLGKINILNSLPTEVFLNKN